MNPSLWENTINNHVYGLFEVFMDTIVICMITAICIMSSGVLTGQPELTGAKLTLSAFQSVLGGTGTMILSVGLALFAFSTVLGWSYYGERNIEKLFGRRAVMPFRVVFSLVVFIGATTELDLVWNFSDVMNGLMALPNLIGLIILSGLVARETKYYLERDPKLEATQAEVEEFMVGGPGWDEWKATERPVK